MTEIGIGKEVVDIVYQYGVVPILLAWVYILTKRVATLEERVSEVNNAHKDDLKGHGEDVKTLLQAVTTELMELRHKLPTLLF